YVVVILAEMYYAMRDDFHLKKTGSHLSPELIAKSKKYLFMLGLIGIPVAIGVHGGTGALFAVVKAREGWFSGMFPIIFLVSALASGGGLLTFIIALTSKLPKMEKHKLLKGLMILTVAIVCFDFLMLTSEILVTFYGMHPHGTTWPLILFGPHWYVFWFIQFGLALVLPIFILANKNTSNSIFWLGAAGLCVVIGILGTRLNIVIPAMMQPQFETLPDAYHHFRFAYGYFPSVNEFLLAIGSVVIGIWAFIYALKKLPMQSTQE
ncbi:MAG: NrfD/PsrC family molybdoenzyme membrane anchor subunit, partial [Bacteroidota bacterium]